MAPPTLTTPLTTLLGIKNPILLAGMARTSSGPLAAAVSNAGGMGVIGGLGYSPKQLREIIHEIKENLSSPDLPFGVDLALEAGILIMNMVGHPKHAVKAFQAGVDIVCAQGGEGGGHTGDISGNILIPAVVDVASNFKSPLTGQKALVVAAGGIYNGRGVAAALMQGAVGVWVGTRFVASTEAGCSKMHKEAVVSARFEDTLRTLVISGRPLRVRMNDYIKSWEDRPEDIRRLTQEEGVVPFQKDMDDGNDVDMPYLMGQVAGVISEIKPAKEIVEEMVRDAIQMLQKGQEYIDRGSKHAIRHSSDDFTELWLA